MVLINETEEELKTGGFDVKRLAIFAFSKLLGDFYAATSFDELEHILREKPPRKNLCSQFRHGAYVTMYHMGVKQFPQDPFDDKRDLALLDRRLKYPLFEIDDGITCRIAAWRWNTSKTYLWAKREWGIDRRRFVNIPQIGLHYSQSENKEHIEHFYEIGYLGSKFEDEEEEVEDSLGDLLEQGR